MEGGSLHVRDLAPDTAEPAGEPILLLTGGPGFSGSFFEPLAKHLAQRHRVLLPDQRGTGRSVMEPWDPAPFTIEGAVADLETIREALGLERWILVGHSWGGILGMSYAATHPERVAGLVLVDSGGVSPAFFTRYQEGIMERLSDSRRRELGLLRPASWGREGMEAMVRESKPAHGARHGRRRGGARSARRSARLGRVHAARRAGDERVAVELRPARAGSAS